LFAADLKAGQTGSYDFGYIDTSAYYGGITYTNVDNSQGFWGLTVGGYSTGSSSTSGTIGTAIMDTGTTLLYLPAAAVKSYYQNVPGGQYSSDQGGYLGYCDYNWPAFNLKIGGTTFTVPGSIINFQPLDDGSGESTTILNESRRVLTFKKDLCFGGLQSNAGLGLSILGDIFIKTKYVIFDQTQGYPRLGVANKN
jgi:aspergillopepsin I